MGKSFVSAVFGEFSKVGVRFGIEQNIVSQQCGKGVKSDVVVTFKTGNRKAVSSFLIGATSLLGFSLLMRFFFIINKVLNLFADTVKMLLQNPVRTIRDVHRFEDTTEKIVHTVSQSSVQRRVLVTP